MDALDFLKAYHRICKFYFNGSSCFGCPLKAIDDTCAFDTSGAESQTIEKVEEWVKEHPLKTRQTVFLKNYPNAFLDSEGCLDICPQEIEKDKPCPYKTATDTFYGCNECCRDYWGEQID